MKTDRVLLIYSDEIDILERSASAQFCKLQREAARRPHVAEIMHRIARRILDDSHLISLFFFPSRSNEGSFASVRARILRDRFIVDDHSLLSKRIVRNHLAHIRLDTWAQTSANQTFGRGMLGSRNDASRLGIGELDILGMIDPATLSYVFQSDEINIEDLINEMRLLGSTARKIIREVPWADGGQPNVQ